VSHTIIVDSYRNALESHVMQDIDNLPAKIDINLFSLTVVEAKNKVSVCRKT
jgi:hypothetical protein